MSASLCGGDVGIPDRIWVLTWYRDPVRGQCQAGSLTGAVASKVTGAPRFPQNGWKSFEECKGIRA